MAQLAEYPSVLPLPLQNGYGLQHVSPLQRVDMDSGRARQRRRYTSVPSAVQVSWLMTETEAQLFEGWYRFAITDGADWFTCRLKTPLGIKPYKARFTDIYDGPKLQGGRYWQFTAELELIERQTLTEQETANAIAGGDLHTIVQQLDVTAQQWYTRHWLQEGADA